MKQCLATKVWGIAALILLLAFSSLWAQYRIMPLGDSITAGTSSGSPIGGYRDDLASLLQNAGIAFNFVGTLTDGTGFDANHEGHNGMRADEIANNLNSWINQLGSQRPRFYMLHIGTNDITQGQSIESTIADIENIVDQIYNEANYNAILLSSLIPRKDTNDEITTVLNEHIINLYYEKRDLGYNIYYVGQNEVFKANPNWSTEYYATATYPNNAGYEVMAEVYFNALTNAIYNFAHGEAPKVTDNFQRSQLGITWSAKPELQIVSNELANTSANNSWDYLATYIAQLNPIRVAIKWSSAANAAGIGEGAVALKLDAPSATANGYICWYSSNGVRLWTILNGSPDTQLDRKVSNLPFPSAGDIFEVEMFSDADGHHFRCYINGVEDVTLSDPNKEQGNQLSLYAGVMLKGNLNNNVTYFDLKGFERVTGDDIPPAAITDLAAGSPTANSITLSWTAVGDDGMVGTASQYDVRYSTNPIADDNDFNSAITASDEPNPSAPGTQESFVVPNLTTSTTYYFAVKTIDDSSNYSPLSNSASAATSNLLYITDNFNRSELGPNWNASSAYQIENGELANTAIVQEWGYLAIYRAVANAKEVFFKYGVNADATGIEQCGFALMMDASTLTANGYSIWARPGRRELNLWIIQNGLTDSRIAQVAFEANAPTPQAGSVFEVKLSTDETGHHFDCFVDDIFAGTLSDPNKNHGNVPQLFAGVNLKGAMNNNVDDFTVGYIKEETPPAAINDLAAIFTTFSSVTLSWTAVGDDGMEGIASQYDLRYSTNPIIDDNDFGSAIEASGEPNPSAPGTQEIFEVSNLQSNTNYYFAIKTIDDINSTSPLSNIIDVTTNTASSNIYYMTDNFNRSVLGSNWEASSAYQIENGELANISTVAEWGHLAIYKPGPNPVEVLFKYGINVDASGIEQCGFALMMDNSTLTANGYSIWARPERRELNLWIIQAGEPSNRIDEVELASNAPTPQAGSVFKVKLSTNETGHHFDCFVDDIFAGSLSDPNKNQGNAAQLFAGVNLKGNLNNNIDNFAVGFFLDGTPPNAITDLTAGSPTTTSITLNWTAVGDDGTEGRASSYDIRYSTTPIANDAAFAQATPVAGEPVPSASGTAESYVASGLGSNTTYYFGMKVLDDALNMSPLSNIASATTGDAMAPAAVSNLTAGSATATSLRLNWTAVGDDGTIGTASSYDIRYSTNPITNDAAFAQATQATNEPVPSVSGTQESFVVSGLQSNMTYYFGMKVADDVPNISPLSNIASAMTSDAIAPAAVTNLSAGSVTVSSITLNWTAVGDDGAVGTASSYDIRYSTNPITNDAAFAQATQATNEPAPSVSGTQESFVVSGLQSNTTYYFGMKVSDEVPNISPLSNITSASTSDAIAPAAITDLSAGSATATSITLIWTAVGDDGTSGKASSYDIRYSINPIANEAAFAQATQVANEPVPSVVGTPESHVVSGLQSNTIYYFRMKVSDEVPNISALSNAASAVTNDITAPAAVTNLSAGSATATSLRLSWTAVGDDGAVGTASSYDIRYSTNPITNEAAFSQATQVANEPVPSVSGTQESYVVGGLQSNTTYYFGMKVADEVPNISSLSNIASAATSDITAPAAVADLSAGSATATSIRLNWTAVGDDGTAGKASSYDIRYSTNPLSNDADFAQATQATNEPVPSVSSTQESFVVSGLQSNITYYFGMKVSDEASNTSPLSNIASATTSDAIAPAAVSNLSAASATATSITLNWTAVGDDGTVGTASSYDIRYSTNPITNEAAFTQATQITNEPVPAVSGTQESYVLSGLLSNTTYYFRMKVSDEMPNISPLSNVASASTLDITPPARVTDLHANLATANSLTLSWTAVGDDGMLGKASSYDIRYSTSAINNDADFSQALQASSIIYTTDNFNRSNLGTDWSAAPAYVLQNGELRNSSTDNNYGYLAIYKPVLNPVAVFYKWGINADAPGIEFGGMALMMDSASPNANGYYLWIRPSTRNIYLYAIQNGMPHHSIGATAMQASAPTPVSGSLFKVELSTDASGHHFDCYVNDIFAGRISDANKEQGNGANVYAGVNLKGKLNNNVDDFSAGVKNFPNPSDPWTIESYLVSGLQSNTTYYFGMKVSDEASNTSPLSNIASASTGDAIPPAAVTDLSAGSATATSLRLNWTAVGDDGLLGTASSYDIRYSTNPITNEATFAQATQAANEPVPSASGTQQSFVVSGLQSNKLYYFGMKVSDESLNTSPLSNIASASTSDAIAPAAVTDLSAGSATANSIRLNWTAVGDDGTIGTASSYDIRYSKNAITNDAAFAQATQATNEPVPSVAGTDETFVVSGLQSNTIYYFGMKVSDEASNRSSLSNIASAATADAIAPAAISDLSAGSATATTLRLTWTAVGDDGVLGKASGYDVRYSTNPITNDAAFTQATQATNEPVPAVPGSQESFVVSGLQSNTLYYFGIKVADEVPNISPLSNVASASTGDAIAPAAVTDLSAGSATTSSITLNWTAVGDDGSVGRASSYDIRYSTNPITNDAAFNQATQVTNEPAPSVSGTQENYVASGLQSNTIYYFGMKVSDESANTSSLSNIASAMTGDAIAPAAVTNLSAGSATATSINLSWTAVGDDGSVGTASSYDIRYSKYAITNDADFAGATQATNEPVPSVTGTQESFVVSGLQSNTTYYFGMKVLDEASNRSLLSNIASATTNDGIAPAAISDLSAGSGTATSLRLNWTAVGDDGVLGKASSYDIRYSTNPITNDATFAQATQATNEPVPSASGTPESFVVSGLQSNTLYYFGMKVADEVPNISPLSNIASASTGDAIPPAAITDLSAGSATTTSLRLNWTAVGDDGTIGRASSYDIRYSTNPIINDAAFTQATQVANEPVPAVAGTQESYLVSGLQSNTLYYFGMKVLDESSNTSLLSNIASASTGDAIAPAAVTDLSAGSATATSINLSWTAVGDDGTAGTASSYDIRYSKYAIINDADFAGATQATNEPVPSVSGTEESFVVSGLQSNTTYYFAMKVSDEVSNRSSLSNVASASTSDAMAPAAISDLSAGSATATSLRLSWTAVGDDGVLGKASSYDIRYSKNAITNDADFAGATQATNEPVPSTSGSQESFVVSGLQSNTTYYFGMKVLDEALNASPLSNVASAATGDAIPPAAVTDLTAGSATTTSITLTWTAVGEDGTVGTASSYDIRYSTNPISNEAAFAQATQVTNEPAPSASGTQESLVVSGLQSNTTYYFGMKVSDDVANISALSNITSATTNDGIAPAAVTDLSAGSATANSIRLNWTAVGDDGTVGRASSYDIRVSKNPINNDADFAQANQVSNEPVPAVSGTLESYLVSGLQSYTTYYFAIKVSDEVPNISALSNIASAATSDNTAPAAVTDLSAGSGTATTVRLSWTAVGDDGTVGKATSYDIRYSQNPIANEADFTQATQATNEPAPSVPGTQESYVVSGLQSNTTYYFRMKVLDDVPNISPLSNAASASTSDAIAPAAIADLSAGSATTTSITLRWTAVGDDGSVGTASSYDIRYSTNPITNETAFAGATQISNEPVPSVSGTQESYLVSGLQSNTTYYFGMKVLDDGQNISALSNIASATTSDGIAPAAIADLSAGSATTTSITLSWTAVGDDGATGKATSYDIRYSLNPITNETSFAQATQVANEPVPSVSGTQENYVVSGLQSNTTYYFGMKVSDEVPNVSALSNIASAATRNVSAETTAPAAVTNLNAGSATASSITLSWTAVGDDGTVGTASSYDIRYSTNPISNDAAFNQATQVSNEPAPSVAGTQESYVVSGLQSNTTYYFGMKVADEVPNISALSNIASASTSDITAPAAVADLSAGSATATSIRLSWTAVGDDGSVGKATSYDIRYSTNPITNNADFTQASQTTNEPVPSTAGTQESYVASGLQSNTTYYFGIKVLDEASNSSALSNIASASTTTATDLIVWPGDTNNSGLVNQADVLPLGLFWGSTGVARANTSMSWTGQTAARWNVENATYADANGDGRINQADVLAIGLNWGKTHGSLESMPLLSAASSSKATIEEDKEAALEPLPLSKPILLASASNDNSLVEFNSATAAILRINITGNPNPNGTFYIEFAVEGVTNLFGISFEMKYTPTSYIASITEEPGSWLGSDIVRYTNIDLNAGLVNIALSRKAGQGGISGSGVVATLRATLNSSLVVTQLVLQDLAANDQFGNPILFDVVNNTIGETDATPPARVTDLSAGSPGQTSIPLTWTAVGDDGMTGVANYYDIRYATFSLNQDNFTQGTKCEGEPTPAAPGTTENFVVTGLQGNMTYYFALGVVDDAFNYSLISNTASATTIIGDVTPPAQIDDLQVSSFTGSSATLTWTAVGNNGMEGVAAGYDMRYSTSEITSDGDYYAATTASGEPQPSAAGETETFTVTGLQQNTTYYFALKAYDDVNNYSPLSNVASVTIPQMALVTETDDFNRGNLGPNWLAHPDYMIQNNELANTATLDDWGYLAIYLPANDPVEVWLTWGSTATAAGIEEGGFAFLNDTTEANLGYFVWLRPSNRTVNLFALQNGLPHHRIGTAVSMADGAPTPVAGSVFKVEISTDGNGHHFTCYVDDVLAGTVSDPIKEVGNAAAYFAGLNLAGNLDNNVDEFSVKYYGETDVYPPAKVTDLAAGTPTPTSVTLTWTAVGDDGMIGIAEYYDIRYATFPLNQDNFVQGTKCIGEPNPAAPGTTETFVVTGLQSNTTYYFALGVVDDVTNYSLISNTVSARTILGDDVPPSQINTLQSSSPTASSVTLTWTAVGDDGINNLATGYDIRYSTNQITTDGHFNAATQATGEPQPTAPGTQQTFVVTGLQANTTYYFAIKAYDDMNNYSPLSNVVSHKTLQVLIIYETDNFNRASLGPNWFASPDYQIQNNELANTSTIDEWGGLAIYLPTMNPVEVSLKWATSADATGIEEGGFAFMNDTTAASPGYFLWLRPSNRTLNLFVIQSWQPDHRIGTAITMEGTAPTPQAGSVVKVIISTDDDGHYFDCYVDDEYAGQISDPNKEIGNIPAPFAGLNLKGNLNNNVDEFSVGYYGTADVTPPAKITNLSVSNPSITSLTLNWTASGDDVLDGVANSYDVRYSLSQIITENDFNQAFAAVGEPSPAAPGTSESFIVSGLQSSKTYYFAVKVSDEAGNYSISNTASGTTKTANITVDNFNRTDLGANWSADPDYQIVGNELDNTSTVPAWEFLAVYNARVNPIEVAFKWGASASPSGIEEGAMALRLNGASPNASGYAIWIRQSVRQIRLWTIVGGNIGASIATKNMEAGAPTPQAGYVFKVQLSSDVQGHHFDVFVNDKFAGTISDPNKLQGNASVLYAGVMLRGGLNNNVDDFTEINVAGTPKYIEYVSGDDQAAPIGSALPAPLVVRVDDTNRIPASGVPIEFRVVQGSASLDKGPIDNNVRMEAESGTLTPNMAMGDDENASGGKYIYGTSGGPKQGKSEYTVNLPVAGNYVIWGRIYAPSAEEDSYFFVVDNSQDTLTWHIQSPFGSWRWAKFTNNFVNYSQNLNAGTHKLSIIKRENNARLDKIVFSSDPTFTPSGMEVVDAYVTDAAGEAQALVMLGNTAGPVIINAEAPGLDGSPIVFNLRATAGNATKITLVSGSPQSGIGGQQLSQPLKVQCLDNGNNGVYGWPVSFVNIQGGGFPSTTQPVTTDESGYASTYWTLGTENAQNIIHAVSTGLQGSPVVFNATAIGGIAQSLVYVSGNGQSGKVGQALVNPLKMRVVDAQNAAIVNHKVKFKVKRGNGSVSTSLPNLKLSGTLGIEGATLNEVEVWTNSTGYAQVYFTLGDSAGTDKHTVEASAMGAGQQLLGSPYLFKATGNPGNPAKVVEVSGDNQTGAAGMALGEPFVIKVIDAYGNGIVAHPVAFEVKQGGGYLTPVGPYLTEAGGFARATLTLGPTQGTINEVWATSSYGGNLLPDSPIKFQATPGIVSTLEYVSGSGQTGSAGYPLRDSLKVKVLDNFGNAVGGYPVVFTSAGATNPGTFNGTTSQEVTVNSSTKGIAKVSFTCGSQIGINSIAYAVVQGLPNPVAFNTTVVGLASLKYISGNGQQAAVGTALPQPFKAQVLDALGNSQPNYKITFQVKSGDGKFSGKSSIDVLTNAQTHIAEATLTLGPVPGNNNNVAEASAVYNGAPLNPPVTFTASATIGEANELKYVSGNFKTAVVGNPLSEPFVVKIVDVYGNPIFGHTVTFSVKSGNGTLDGSVLTIVNKPTNISGLAQVVLTVGAAAGINNNAVEAKAFRSGSQTQLLGSPFTFYATALSSAASQLIYVSGNAQPESPVRTALPQPFKVKVADKVTNAVQGHPVKWSCIQGGGTFDNLIDTTKTTFSDNNGIAQVVFYPGPIAGVTNLVQAASWNGPELDNSPITFTVTTKAAGVSATRSDVAASGPVLADNISKSTITATLMDDYGNKIQGRALTLTVSGSANSITPFTLPTNANGQTVAYLSSTKAEFKKIVVIDILGGITLQDTAVVQFRSLAAQSISYYGGTNQSSNFGTGCKNPVTARVTDMYGNVIEGHDVNFEAYAGGGYIYESQPVKTDGNGIASARWVLGPSEVINRAKAIAEGLIGSPVDYIATGKPGTATTLAYVSGNQQNGVAGKMLPEPIVVQVVDNVGDPIADAKVIFKVDFGGGSFNGSSSEEILSDVFGYAKGYFVLGSVAGSNIASVEAPGLAGSPRRFTAMGVAGLAEKLVKYAGDGSTIAVNGNRWISVKITDIFDNPVAGYSVSFAVVSGDASIQTGYATAISNSDGIASSLLRGGTTLGKVEVIVMAPELIGDGTKFTLTIVARPAIVMQKYQGDNQEGTISRELVYPLSVVVKDDLGNPAGGQNIPITFALTGNYGILLDQLVYTNDKGIASARLKLEAATGSVYKVWAINNSLNGSPLEFTAKGVTNKFPQYGDIPDYTVEENQTVSFSVNATDEDGDAITYGIQSLPTGAEFDSIGSRLFSWKPNYAQAGIYVVHFMARDNKGGFDDEPVTITVENVNHKPRIINYEPIAYQIVGHLSVGEIFRFMVQVSDEDGEIPSYLWYNDNLLVSIKTYYDCKVAEQPIGNHVIKVKVSDGYDTIEKEWMLSVKTPVELANFAGCVVERKGVELTWETTVEANNAGFNIYRKASRDNEYEKINFMLIRSDGSKKYSYLDREVTVGEYYKYRLEDVSLTGEKVKHEPIEVFVTKPENYELAQNYPNPFNSNTIIRFQMPEQNHISVQIYNLLGQEVITLLDDVKEAGYHALIWDGFDKHGNLVGSGVYYYRVVSGSFIQTKKMVLLK